MELADRAGVTITLRPLRYESPEMVQGDGNDWVVILVQVAAEADAWSFEAALLLSSEVKELSDWLRGVASGVVPTGTDWLETNMGLLKPLAGPPAVGSTLFGSGDGVVLYTEPGVEIEGPYPRMMFAEPGLSMSLLARSAEAVTFDVEFWRLGGGERSGSYSLTMAADELGRAVDQWDRECTAVLNDTAWES